MAARPRGESAERVSRCVTALLRRQPFFGALALRLPVRADAGRETLASDGREIRYSPAWIAETDAHLIETAIARVVLACALKHHTRRGGRDPERWQHASQLVTHGLLKDAGFVLPPDAEAWDGISVEQAYDRLPEPDADDAAPPGPDGAGNGNRASGSPDGSDGGNAGDPSGRDEPGQDGAGPPSCDPAGTGEVMDAPGALAAEEQAWDEAMHQAASLAKAEGRMPGAVEETVRGAHAAALDWRALLRRFMTGAAKSDYSWSVPNRRFIDSGLYLPSLRSEGMDAIAVIVDTSGSVDTATLAAFWSEVREAAMETDPARVIVLQVDTAVRDAADHAPDDLPEEIVVRGRGGTDFRPGFAWLEAHGVQPAVCLYFTDMACDRYPEAEPPFPVLWCDWQSGSGPFRSPPPWGEHLAIA